MSQLSGFCDRTDAGRQLAAQLAGRDLGQLLVVALPRGGVEVGFEIARILESALDVIPARKLGSPQQPELAIGAVAPGAAVLNEGLINQLGLSSWDVDQVIEQEEQEMARRANLFRAGRAPLDVRGKTVVLVDDGLATGATAEAAIQSIRRGDPAKVILAVPVGAEPSVDRLAPMVDELICLLKPPEFRTVGEWYDDFEQTSDQHVIELLRRARKE